MYGIQAKYCNTKSFLWVPFGYQRWLDVSTDGLFVGIPRLIFFNVIVLSIAYRVY